MPYRAAVLADSALPVQGCATPAETFERVLRAAGIPIDPLSADQLADPARFNADRYDLLIVRTGATFPLSAKQTLLAFLHHGGDLLCTGGYAFDDPVVRDGGRWEPYTRFTDARATLARSMLMPNGDFHEGSLGWTADVPAQCRIDRSVRSKPCAAVTATSEAHGARWGARLAVQPGGTYLIGADASPSDIEGAGFGFLSVYQYDAAEKLITFRDFAKVRGTAGWKRFEARITIAPNAARVIFYGGMYLATGTMRFTRVTCGPVPAEVRINAHYGEPLDSLIVKDTQLTLYSPDQPLHGASLAPAQSWGMPTTWRSPGAVSGFEATAQLRDSATWTPLVDARDRYGRFSGCAGAIVHHYAGTFAGSNWALFGATNRDIFAGVAGEALLRATARLLETRVYIDRLATDYPIYHPGETARVGVSLVNEARQARTVTVSLALAAPGAKPLRTDRRALTLEPGQKSDVTFLWRVPAAAPDFIKVCASLSLPDGPVGRATTGFCAYSKRAMQSGPQLRFRDNAFELRRPDGHVERTTLFGTDTWAAMFSSRAQNPWTWYRDLQMMRDYGLHMVENLGFATKDYRYTKLQWRQLDALIQLSQRFGLPYMAGLLVGENVAVDDATLRKQAELCREFAKRYRDVPGLIYYLNGDYRCEVSDTPSMLHLWRRYLAGRYRTPYALRSVWGAGAEIGKVPPREVSSESWYDPRQRDLKEFRASLVRRWVTALSRAIRSQDRMHPITGEYYQRPVGGIDLRLELAGIDVANFGYFDAPKVDLSRLPATIKWNDMRRAGKSTNIGEFGVKTHDAWAASRGAPDYHVARTPLERRELFWWMVHAALAYGVTKIQNWCWADDPDNIFPWGVAWRNPLHPKPVLKLWRDLGVFSGRVTPTYHPRRTVLVMPVSWRLGAPEPAAYRALTNTIGCLLAAGVPFDVINENEIPNPAAPFPKREGGGGLRTIVAPLAYCFTDAEIDALRRLAQRGATVYVSGDVSVGPEGARRPERLARLCGVRESGKPRMYGGLPEPIVSPLGATVVRVLAGARVFRHRIGRGEVIYSPRPWEALPGADVFGGTPAVVASRKSNLYLSLLKPAVRLTARRGVWTGTAAPVGADRLISVLPHGDTPDAEPITLREGGRTWRMEPGAGLPCMVLSDPEGRPIAATGGMALSLDGREVASGTQPWMLVALDGRPLSSSRALAVALMEDGTLGWRSDAPGLRSQIVEWRDGRAVRIAPLPLQSTGAGWQVKAPANELVLVCAPSETRRWLRALRRR